MTAERFIYVWENRATGNRWYGGNWPTKWVDLSKNPFPDHRCLYLIRVRLKTTKTT
jgi:hypothetical protein